MKALKKDATLRYQNATSFVYDLKRALKEPNGDFVDNDEYVEDFPTQRISTLGLEEDRSQNSKSPKKNSNKFVEFYWNFCAFKIEFWKCFWKPLWELNRN